MVGYKIFGQTVFKWVVDWTIEKIEKDLQIWNYLGPKMNPLYVKFHISLIVEPLKNRIKIYKRKFSY